MSDTPSLQFDRPDFGAPSQAAVVCSACKRAVVQSYYEINGQIVCSGCRETLTQDGGSRVARVIRSVAAGLGVGLLGALVWWGVRKATNYEIGIISIGIGIAVGKAVRWGSRARGGAAYQILAILLTYISITANYVPDVVEQIMQNNTKQEQAAKPAAKPAAVKASAAESSVNIGEALVGIVAIFALAAAVPFFGGFENIIGILIIAFGLFEAWKINKRVALTINGPYSVAPTANG
jgi:hypothetical protein